MKRVARHLSFVGRHASLVGVLIVFVLLAAWQLSLPGLHYDEAKEAGLNAMQLVLGQPVTAFRGATIGIGRWRLPLMVQDYIGALNVVLAVPFLALGGLNVSALRSLPIGIAAMTLVITAGVARRLGGPRAAAVAALLLAVNPTFVFWSRQGIFVTNLTALCFMASLWTGLRWWRERRPADLWWTAFLWGLGLYAKLLFIWAIGALTAVMLVLWGAEWLRSRQAAGPSDAQGAPRPGDRAAGRSGGVWAMAIGCFLLPLIPLIVFNWQTGGTLISIFSNLGQSYYGVNNRAYLPNLATRVGQLITLLRGDHLWYLGEVYANRWAPWLAAAALALAGLLAAWPRPLRAPSPGRATPLLPAALVALIVAQSAFTVSDLFITHYALLVPLVPLGIGLVVERLSAYGRGRFGRLVVGAALLAPVVWWGATDLANTLRYHRILTISGGYAAHSDAIYALADFLAQREPSAPLALDWGIDAPVRFLTAGRVNPVEVFGYERLDGPDAGFAGRVAPSLDNPDNLYVAHAGEFVVFRGRVEALGALAAGRGQRLQEIARFGERSGRPLFIVYQAAR